MGRGGKRSGKNPKGTKRAGNLGLRKQALNPHNKREKQSAGVYVSLRVKRKKDARENGSTHGGG